MKTPVWMKNTALVCALMLAPWAHATDASTLTIIHNPTLSYPLTAKKQQQEGLVIVYGQVNAQGNVIQTQVKQSSGHDALDTAALKHVQKIRFKALPESSQPIGFEQPVHFKL